MASEAKILVTGADQMLGEAILEQLIAEGNFVRALVSTKENLLENNNIDYQVCDLLDIGLLEDALENIEQVYHCADWLSYAPKDKEALYKFHVIGTENLVNVALAKQVKKIVYLSSTQAFGTYQHKSIINEKTKKVEHKQNTYYSICKSRAELEIHRGIVEGIDGVILCPSIILGKSKEENLYDFLQLAEKNYRFYPKGINGFVGLQDVVNLSILCMQDENIRNEKFIVSAENLSYETVLGWINPKLQKKNPFRRMNLSKAKLVSKINSLRNYFFDTESFLMPEMLNFNAKKFEFSHEKIKEHFNYKFTSIKKVITDLT